MPAPVLLAHPLRGLEVCAVVRVGVDVVAAVAVRLGHAGADGVRRLLADEADRVGAGVAVVTRPAMVCSLLYKICFKGNLRLCDPTSCGGSKLLQPNFNF